MGKGTEFIIELPIRLVESSTEDIDKGNFNNIERVSIEFSDIYELKK